MKELVEYLVKNIVTTPEEVNVLETQEDNRTVLHITVDPQDTGIVIGKGGKTINSIRNLVKAKAIKDGVYIDVKIDTKDEE